MKRKKASPSSVSRRDFLKTSSAVVAGGILVGGFPSIVRAQTPELTKDPIRLALIGCGGRGTGAANQAMNTGVDVRLVAMADAFPDRLAKSLETLSGAHPSQVDVPEERRFVGFDGYKEAIALADVVILTTPPGFRPLHFEAAVEAGKHVFMEKPVAVDAPGIRKVLEAAAKAKEKGLKVGVGFQRRHQDGYVETVKRIHDGAIGETVSSRCYWNSGGVWVKPRQPEWTELEYQMRNWYYFNWLCGDHIVEQHVHNIDVINWVKGAFPIRAQGQGGRQIRTGIDHGQIFDHHFVEFEYADGTRLYSQCRHQPGWNNVSEFVQGTRGKASLAGYEIEGEELWKYSGDNPNPYQIEHDVLFDAIRNNKVHDETDYGIKSTMCGILGRMCTYSNQMISWDDALASTVDLAPDVLSWESVPPVLPDADGRYPIPEPGKIDVL
ncbi:MAG TPA: Gfo/Idh/MocA family oxidoreductase [Opitutales bacterium]|nr:Gfo/Idh/MocA family oxidoreductase [Opitutales bacterium]